MIGAMRRMTIETVLPDRRMFKQQRPAFFLVAIETELVDGQITK